ncbi:diguanylate cyclase (GGDEF)-like protein/PAS domain S-box-containing protein [Phenylobacterium koreense]|uniref:Diguanylate cyclase (GGDEF)-like protein/PAS domain S-box-containing protein n=1 Tax=Phenylobacterium koreense TaxID=266125 RepID=A0ABV2EFH9_9CAUL
MELLQAVVDALPDPTVIKDREHRWLAINEPLLKMLGYPLKAIVGRTDLEMFPSQGERHHASDDDVFRTGQPADYERVVTSRNGQISRSLLTRKRLLHLPESYGGGEMLIATFVDVTPRRRAEAKLQEAEEHHRHALMLNPQIPWTADPGGKLLEVGPVWEMWVGMSLEEAMGGGWAQAVHPDDLAPLIEAWNGALASGRILDSEYRLRMAGGEYRWVRAWAAPRRDESGAIMLWYGAVEDINDRKLAEAALVASEREFSEVANAAPAMIWTNNAAGEATFVSRLWCETTGQDPDEPLGQGWLERIHPDDRAQVKAAAEEARAARRTYKAEYRVRTRSGDWIWVMDVGEPRHGPGGEFLGYVGSMLDVTERRQAAAKLDQILESTTDCVVLIDRHYRLTYINGNAHRKLKDRSLVIGGRIRDIFPEEAGGIFAQQFAEAFAQQTPVMFEARLAGVDDWFEVHAFPTEDGLSVFFRDISARRTAEQERAIAQEKMIHMARHDALTELPNRVLFRERLERVLADNRSPNQTAVLYIDLDGFKDVNDTAGHGAGDVLLRLVAQRLQRGVRSGDTVTRLGGDEFAIIQTQVRQGADAADLADRIVRDLAEPFEIEGRNIVIGASVGIALAPADASDPEELLRAADTALYRAKAEGKGAFRLFEPGMDEQLKHRQALKLALHGALKRDEFSILYQPMVDLSSGRIRAFEALLRWRHPELGAVCPTEFIPLAEETGLIVGIGAWILREACRAASRWPDDICLSVNLSPAQFRSAGLVSTVRAALTETQLPTDRLQLEITESVLLRENRANLQILTELRRLGVKIALDDFGTGYSSLGYLHQFPFDKIKLDRSFVQNLPGSREGHAIVTAVAAMAQGLGISLTAEGVETSAQAALLRERGYSEGQGYLFSEPVSEGQARRLIGHAMTVYPVSPA